MSERELFSTLTLVLLAVALASFVLLLFVPAPYGRHARTGWGPRLPARIGWFLMTSPAVIVFALAFFSGDRWLAPAPLALFALWELHYVHRAWIYPFRIRAGGPVTWLVVGFVALLVTAPYGYLNGRQIGHLGHYPASWLVDPRFLSGTALFLTGFFINLRHDGILIRMRALGEAGHRLPTGGLYRWLSCPNYFGELIEWTGWAIAAWSLPSLAYALWGAANLLPRALANHRWYRESFPDYPRERRALVPGLL
jgi:3-oxo-5-alpha-steroid 4-dehydrogenase 1